MTQNTYFRCSRAISDRALISALLLSFSAISASAQTASSTEGAIIGTVTDSSGAAIAGVKVTLSGPNVMGTPSTMTGQNGGYRLPAIPPGDYSLKFEQTGFATVTEQDIHISLGFTASVNIQMRPGAVSETITVSGEAPVIDTQANNITTSLDSQKLVTLPGSRDFWAVVAQVPAVAVTKMDVGGSDALTQQPYTAYGLTSAGGVNRGEVEGIMVNEGAGGGGADPARDIVAITVNRWPHGYAYTYNTLFEPAEWVYTSSNNRPCVIARQPFGSITIANSDAAASPHTDAAFLEAHRAVEEVLERRTWPLMS